LRDVGVAGQLWAFSELADYYRRGIGVAVNKKNPSNFIIGQQINGYGIIMVNWKELKILEFTEKLQMWI